MKITGVLSRRENIDKSISLLVLGAAFIYAFLRAYRIPIGHDEAITFLFANDLGWQQIFLYAHDEKANNHLLNTILIKLFLGLFGNKEIVIRLPALLGLLLYLYSAYRILNLFTKRHVLVVGVSLLALQVYLLDYFSVARGYALSLGFFLLGFYYVLKTIGMEEDKQQFRYMLLSAILLSFSVLSNLAWLNPFLGILIIPVLAEIRKGFCYLKQGNSTREIIRRVSRNVILPLFPPILVLVGLIAYPIYESVKADSFYYGGEIGFWADTVTSLVEGSLHRGKEVPRDAVLLGKVFVIFVLILSISLLFYRYRTERSLGRLDLYQLYTLCALFLCFISIQCQHMVLATKYPLGRTGAYFIPLFLVLFVLLWEQTRSLPKRAGRTPIQWGFYAIAIGTIVYNLTQFNISYTVWRYDASTKKMLHFLAQVLDVSALKAGSIRMGITWRLEPSLNYYIRKNQLTWLHRVDRRGMENRFFHFYYIHLPVDGFLLEKYNLKVIQHYELSETCLAVPPQVHFKPSK